MIRFILILFFSGFVFSGGIYASELTLDEHVPVSLREHSSLAQTQQRNIAQPVAVVREEKLAQMSSHNTLFDMWWLLILLAIFANVWLVWKKGISKKIKDEILLPHHSVELTDVKKAAKHAAELRKIVDKPKLKLNSYKNTMKPEDLFEYNDLKTAYEFYCSGKNEEMLDIMVKGFKHEPFDMPVYIMAMNILSESDKPLPELEKLLKTGLLLLRMKRPLLWQEVSEKGQLLTPHLEAWFWQR